MGESIGWHYVCLFCRAYVVSTLLQLPIESQLKLHAIFPQQRIKSLLPPPTITRTTATTTTRTTTRKVSREIIKILITQLYGKLVDPISHRSLKSQRKVKNTHKSQLGTQSLFTSAALGPFDGFVCCSLHLSSFRTISDFYNRFSMLVISYYFQHLFALCYRGIAKP